MSDERFRRCAEAPIPIPETLLRDAAKNLGSLLSSQDSDSALLSRLTQALLATAHVPDLANPHRVAACNALCGTLEQCLSSSREDVHHLAIAPSVREKLFSIYVDVYDNGKGKAMKQVLGTMVKLLSKSCEDVSSSEPVDSICLTCFEIAFRARDRTRTKPALYALTLFLSRKLLSSTDMLRLYNRSIEDGNQHGARSASENPPTWSTNADRSISEDITPAAGPLLEAVLSWMPVGDIAPAAGQILTALLSSKEDKSRRGLQQDDLPVWVKPLVRGIAMKPDELQAYRNHAFPALFQDRIQDFKSFLDYLGLGKHLGISDAANVTRQHRSGVRSSVLERSILFSALQAGKASGLVREYTPTQYHPEVLVRQDVLFIPDSVLGELCAQASPDARLAGLALLISSASATRPLTTPTLAYLKKHIPHMFADVDPNFRGEVHSLFQALVNRLRAILAVLARQKLKMANGVPPTDYKHDAARTNDVHTQAQAAELFQEHSNFLTWILMFLRSELGPSASYQRHISALKALSIVLKSGLDENVELSSLARSAKGEVRWPLHLQIVDSPTMQALLDLLLDPFDDVRQTSLEILITDQRSQSATSSEVGGVSKSNSALERAREIMVRSGRVDQADGVARLYSLTVHGVLNMSSENSAWAVIEDLISRVDRALELAEHNITVAVRDHPVHGLFTALRYALEQVFQHSKTVELERRRCTATLDRICEALPTTWNCVRHLLCNDAPEGFMPEDMEDDDSLTTKDLLSYAWRGLKESSLLLRALISPECLLVLGQDEYDRRLPILGDLCFSQLAELRHRGAFSTVAQTFALLCRQCAVSKNSRCRSLTLKWYEETLNFIQQKANAITRRSAGLPQIIVGLVASDDSGILYKQAMSNLSAMSEIESYLENDEAVDLPQVHALNSIRAIFITSRLASRSENSIVPAMSLAARCLSSRLWAIRNCGLMLFRSLIDRMLGSNESADDFFEASAGNVSRLSYEKHPGLLELIMQLLRSSSATAVTVEGTNAGLSAEAIFLVLDLLRRAPPPESARLEVVNLVFVACSNKSWHIRDMASRTLAALTKTSQIENEIARLTTMLVTSRNATHGHLLAIKYMSKAWLASDKEVYNAILQDQTLPPGRSSTCTTIMLNVLGSDSALCQRCVHRDTDDTLASAYLDILNLLGMHLARDTREDSTSLEAFGGIVRRACATLLLRARQRRSSSILRIAVFKASCLAALLSNSTPVVENLPYFGDEDVSGMIEVLEGMHESLAEVSSRGLLGLLLTILPFCEPGQTRLRSSILKNIVHTLADMPSTEVWEHTDIVQSLSTMQIATTISQSEASSDMYSELGIWGYVLASQYISLGKWTSNAAQDIHTLLRLCSGSLDENNVFPMRYAAALSLQGLSLARNGLQSLSESAQVEYYICLYQALVDDDEDIRMLASRTVVKAVHGVNDVSDADQVVPQVAAQILCAYLLEKFPTSLQLFESACTRLLGQDLAQPSWIAVPDLLRQALNADVALFGEEKQNLYVDDVREAWEWSRVLLLLTPTSSADRFTDKIHDWALNGLECMINKARQEVNGALGWASKRDVFALGVRIILAAEMLLHWRTELSSESDHAPVLQKLKELAEVGVSAELPGIWLHHLERIQVAKVDSGKQELS